MVLIVGGAGQGKLEYVLGKAGLGPEDVARTPEEAAVRPIFYGLEHWEELDVDALLAANPNAVLICREVGCGVVPVAPEERAWREAVGRLCCRLAERAARVERIFCGLPLVLKERRDLELVLVRHSTTQGNLEKRFIGTLDVGLAPQGEELARRVGPALPAVEHIYRSPLKRCLQTARLLWPGVPSTVVEELRETDFGPFEGKNHEELKDNPLYCQWLEDPCFSRMPVGEPAGAVVERVSVGLARVAENALWRGFSRVAVVSHGGALMGLLSKYGRPERPYYDWMCPNCGGFRARLDPDTLELEILEALPGDGAL